MPNGYDDGPYAPPPPPAPPPFFVEHSPIWVPFDILLNLSKTAGAVIGTAIMGLGHTAAEAGRDVAAIQHQPPPQKVEIK